MSLTLTDAIISFVVMVGVLAISPIIFEFSAMVQSEADPLSGMILSLVLPLLIIAVLVSVAVSARRAV